MKMRLRLMKGIKFVRLNRACGSNEIGILGLCVVERERETVF
jgi:hypothetical protein